MERLPVATWRPKTMLRPACTNSSTAAAEFKVLVKARRIFPAPLLPQLVALEAQHGPAPDKRQVSTLDAPHGKGSLRGDTTLNRYLLQQRTDVLPSPGEDSAVCNYWLHVCRSGERKPAFAKALIILECHGCVVIRLHHAAPLTTWGAMFRLMSG